MTSPKFQQWQKAIRRNNYLGNVSFPTSSVCSICPPQTIRIIRIHAERLGQEPQFPDPDCLPLFASRADYSPGNDLAGTTPIEDGGMQIQQTCLSKRILACKPTVTITGQKIYRADAEFIMALSRAPNPGERLDLGTDMWLLSGPESTSKSGQLTASDWSMPPSDQNTTGRQSVAIVQPATLPDDLYVDS